MANKSSSKGMPAFVSVIRLQAYLLGSSEIGAVHIRPKASEGFKITLLARIKVFKSDCIIIELPEHFDSTLSRKVFEVFYGILYRLKMSNCSEWTGYFLFKRRNWQMKGEWKKKKEDKAVVFLLLLIALKCAISF